jgi:hypothetical protein
MEKRDYGAPKGIQQCCRGEPLCSPSREKLHKQYGVYHGTSKKYCFFIDDVDGSDIVAAL